MKWRLTVSVVPRGAGQAVASAAAAAGAGGGTVLLGTGTAPNPLLQFLGLGERRKDIALNLSPEKFGESVGAAIRERAAADGGRGIVFSTDAACVVRSGERGEPQWEDCDMDDEGHMAIVAIVNRGYAEDAIAAARRAGATGGTILAARGTAREDDAAFFGVRLTPEKDVLLVVAGMDDYRAILEAIRSLPAFAEKGSGIAFAVRTHDFGLLGGKESSPASF